MQKLTFYTVMLVLLVLPVLMIGVVASDKPAGVGPKVRCKSITFFSNPGCGLPNPHPVERSYREFALTSDTKANANVFRQMRVELRNVRKNRHCGIRIRISNKASFQDFITGMDVCSEGGPIAYAALQNDIWIPSPPEFEEPFPEGFLTPYE